MAPGSDAIRLRDPAARGRIAAVVAAVVVLGPLLVVAQFEPWLLFDAASLQASRSLRRRLLPAEAVGRLPRRDAARRVDHGRDRHGRADDRRRGRRAARARRDAPAVGLARSADRGRTPRRAPPGACCGRCWSRCAAFPRSCWRCCSCASSASVRRPACWRSRSPTARCSRRCSATSSSRTTGTRPRR